MKKILCICLSSTIQRTITFKSLAAAQVNRSEKYRQDASGKAVNSARVLNQLEKGCAVTLCPLGKENQELFLRLAQNDALEISYVPIPGFTRECWTLLDRSAGTTTELVVGEPVLSSEEMKEAGRAENLLLKYITDKLPETDAVLLAGSRPKIWSEDLYAVIAGITKDNGKLFLADFTGSDLEQTLKTAVPDIIKINDEEFCSTFTTRGKDSTLAARNGEFFECPAEIVEAVNTTACGDSFNAGFLYEFVNTGDFMAALKKGTWCAARNAELEVPGGIR